MVKVGRGGRPRKHATEDERRAARRETNRLNWARHSAEHKEARRNRYREQNPRLDTVLMRRAQAVNDPLYAVPTAIDDHLPPEPPTDYSASSRERFRVICMRRVDQATVQFEEYMGGDHRTFMDNLVTSYLARVATGHGENYKDQINVALIYISGLRNRCYQVQQKFWETFGAGPEYDQIDERIYYMRRVEKWVGDVLCEAMVCNTRLAKMFARRELEYQLPY